MLSLLRCSKLEDMDMWMEERHLPAGVKDKVRRYYVEVWAQHTGAQHFLVHFHI